MIEFASGQIQGRRAAQEDALDVLCLTDDGMPPKAVHHTGKEPDGIVASAPGLVMVVADGMGGHVGGRVASSLSVRSFLDSVRQSSDSWDKRLEAGLNAANEALRRESDASPDLAGMGSTLVSAVVSDEGLGWISIGDSALYHFRAGTLTRLNEDHSFGAYLDQQAREGLMSAEAASLDRRRNHLFYALLGDQLDHYERFSGLRSLEQGDLVLAASDGLKTLADEDIRDILASAGTRPLAAVVADLLSGVETANRDRQDNVSLILARVVPAIADPVAIVRDAPTVEVIPHAADPATVARRRAWLVWLGLVACAVIVIAAVALGLSATGVGRT